MIRYLLASAFVCVQLFASAQLPDGTTLYDRDGNKVEYATLVDRLKEAQVVLFGELHGIEATHILEQNLAKSLFETVGEKLILGGEMWEFDQQEIVNEYTNKLINHKQFTADARLWPNYNKDYRGFIDVARDNKLDFIATNIPRRYASVVYHSGPDALLAFDKATRKQLPKLPFTFDKDLPIYADIAEQMGGHGSENLATAQAIKDATMAMYILDNTKKKNLFFHIHGEYHSKEFQGIYNYIKQQKGKWDVLSISSVMQDDVDRLEDDNYARADFIFVVKAMKEDNTIENDEQTEE
ncbi:MAG: ChaN family lipoprotein [Cryomorphaceae bacterium]|nr:ChaN family lipoprotein [Cryomorphaceae bacterium]